MTKIILNIHLEEIYEYFSKRYKQNGEQYLIGLHSGRGGIIMLHHLFYKLKKDSKPTYA